MAVMNSCLTPFFSAVGSWALYSYCWVHCLAVSRMTNSLILGPTLLWKRRYSPVFCRRLMNSGLRRSGMKGPPAPAAPRGPAVTSSSAFRCASVIFSLGIGGMRSCAAAALKQNKRRKESRAKVASLTGKLLLTRVGAEPFSAKLLGRFHFGVKLGKEAVRGLLGIGHPRVIFGGRVLGEHLFLRLALGNQFRYAIAYGQEHVPVRHDFHPANNGPMAGHDLRIRPRQPDHNAKPVEHAIKAA